MSEHDPSTHGPCQAAYDELRDAAERYLRQTTDRVELDHAVTLSPDRRELAEDRLRDVLARTA